MARYQIEWLPSDAIAPLDDEGAAPGDGEVELNTETQVAAAEDWSGAISQLLHELGCDDQPVDEVICALSPAGRWSVEAPDGRRAALVPLPEIEVELEPDAPSLLGRLLGPQGDATALPSPAHLAPRVGDHADAGATLDGLLAVVPAESGAVLLHAPAAAQLAFVAARGPRAAAVEGLRIPDDTGIAGLCLSSGTAIALHEAPGGPAHDPGVDRKVGYRTRSLLAVPIRRDGVVVGVLELLNVSSGAFEPWHRTLATEAATGLGRRLPG